MSGADAGSDRVAAWRDPGFLAALDGWVDDRLSEHGLRRAGPSTQPHVQAWATVLRVPTSGGDVWAKAVEPALRHEVALTLAVSGRVPDVVPPPLATDAARGWLLSADAGARLREVVADRRSLDLWLPALAGAARVSLACEDLVDDLLAAGVPDRRLPTLPGAFAALVDGIGAEPRLRGAVGLVEELCGDLAGHGVPDSVEHDDLHDAQVFVGDDGRPRLLDWGDACIAHPFFVLAVALDGVVAWGLDDVAGSEPTERYRDAFLAPYAAALDLDPADLVAASATARRLGWVCRAVNGHVPGDEAATLARLRMFLDGAP